LSYGRLSAGFSTFYETTLQSDYSKAEVSSTGYFSPVLAGRIRAMPTTNTFYIAANIIFDLATGEAKNVLMLVNKPEQASIFSATEAQTYKNFVGARASKIIWSVEQVLSQQVTGYGLPRLQPEPQQFIIKGVTYV
jgi:hypothetical protein